MTVIKTSGNRVVIDEPQENDTHVQVVWFGPPQDGLHRKVFEGPLMPVEQMADAVAWARKMAEQIVHTLYVVPLTGVQAIAPEEHDIFVATYIDGRCAGLRAIVDYEQAVRDAHALARDRRTPVKVLPLSGEEARNLGLYRDSTEPTPLSARDSKLIYETLVSVARDSNDPDARRDAFHLLSQMGAVRFWREGRP